MTTDKQQSGSLLIVSRNCVNCNRLLDTLSTIENSGIKAVDYSVLTPMQRVGITAVPTLILNNGRRLVGTECFSWIDSINTSEPDGFDISDMHDGLVFSDVSASIGYAVRDTTYGAL